MWISNGSSGHFWELVENNATSSYAAPIQNGRKQTAQKQKTENHDGGVGELWWPSLVSDFVVGYLEYQPLPVTKIVDVAKQLKILKLSSSY